MQQIAVIVEAFEVDRLTRALRTRGIPSYTVTAIRSYSAFAKEVDEILSDKARIEFIVADEEVLKLIDMIREEVSKHQDTDGLITVSEVKHLVAIKSGQSGMAALSST